MSQEENDIVTFEPLLSYEEEFLRNFRFLCENDPQAAGAFIALLRYAVAYLEGREE